jgi:putative phosphoribosyl transferase
VIDVALPLANRREAGAMLAERLQTRAHRSDVLVLALPRGGVPVGFEIAERLHVQLDVLIVRKLGVPGHEELAMGAVASGGLRVLNEDVVSSVRIDPDTIDAVARAELRELERREALYRHGRPALQLAGRIVVLVDDGLATGSSMRVAIQAVQREKPARTIVAVPVAAEETCAELSRAVDEMICLYTPEPFYAVGLWYADFRQTTDEEVIELLGRSAERQPVPHVPREVLR